MMTLKQDLQFNIWVVLVSKNNRWFAVAVFKTLDTKVFCPKECWARDLEANLLERS